MKYLINIHNDKGFTFIEIISVLVIIGILTFVIMSRGGNYDVEVYADAQVLKNHLRYAQVKAMNSTASWGINFSAGNYVMEDDSANSQSLPGEMPVNVSYSSTVDPIMFDQRGSPGTTTATITLTKGGSSATVIVTKNTGYIP